MKLLKLEICNIASFDKVEIDFAAAPLNDTDIFLISGETGSGKSTILDAICLALYDETPRLDNTNDPKTSDSLDITLTDSRRLLSRNKGFGEVKLLFESDGDQYTARWYVQRSRKRVDGRLQNREWTLTDHSTGKVLSKVDEVSRRVKEILGLQFKQFTRTTMLSQGEFASFLKSRGDEKAELLQKITGLDRFEKIGRRIFEETSIRLRVYDDAKRDMERASRNVLDEEQIDQLNHRLQILGHRKGWFGRLEEDNGRCLSWLNTMKTAVDEGTATSVKLASLQEQVQTDEYRAAKELLRMYDDSAAARVVASECIRLQQEWLRLDGLLSESTDAFVIASGAMESLIARENGKRVELTEVEKDIATHAGKVAVYNRYDEIVTLLNSVSDSRKEIERIDSRLASKQADAAKLQTAYEVETAEAEEQKKSLDAKISEAEKLEANFDSEELDRLREIREASQQRKNKLESCIKCQDDIAALNGEKNKLNQKATDNQNNRNNAVILLAKREEELAKTKTERDVKQAARDAYSNAAGKAASALRVNLHEGDTCPVCGGIVSHQLPIEKELKDLLGKANEELKNAGNLYDEALKGVETQKGIIKSADDMAQFLKGQLDGNDSKLTKCNEDVENICAELEIPIDKSGKDELVLILSDLAKELDAVQKQIELAESVRKAIDKAKKDIDKQRVVCDKKVQTANKTKDKLTAVNSDMEKLRGQRDVHGKIIDESLSKVAGLPDISNGWKNDYAEFTSAFIKELSIARDSYQNCVKRQEKIMAELEQLKGRIKVGNNQRDMLLRYVPVWSSVEPSAKGVDTDKMESMFESLRNDVAVNCESRKDCVLSLVDSQLRLAQMVESMPGYSLHLVMELACRDDEEMLRIRNHINDCEMELNRLRGGLDVLNNRIKELQQQTPSHLLKAEDLASTTELHRRRADRILAGAEMVTTEIGDIRGRLKTNSVMMEGISNLHKDLQNKEKEWKRYEQLNSMLGDKNGKRFRTIALSYILNHLISGANKYMSLFSDRYTLQVEPGTYLINVVDAYQGYAKRSCNTISGGETFLVSLSLALALSDVGGLSGCDTLFIDEGFGTLSGEPLTRAVETLRTLHRSSGRRVGIISHVAVLRDSIPVQIAVQRKGVSGISEVTVV